MIRYVSYICRMIVSGPVFRLFTRCLAAALPLLLAASAADGQSLSEQLTEHGFENVWVVQNGSRLYVAYENRMYRSEAHALATVLNFAGGSSTAADSLTVVIRQNELPVLAMVTCLYSLRQFLRDEITYESWIEAATLSLNTGRYIQDAELRRGERSTRLRPVFPVGLGMRYQLGNYNEPYRFAFDLQPEIQLPLGRGFTARARAAIPLFNNFDDNRHMRPSLATLTRHFLLDDALYGAVSAGIFGKNRAGVHSALKVFLHEEVFSLTIDAGYTVYTPLTGNVNLPRVEDQPYTFYTLTADYRLRAYDLNVRMQYGRFLYGDQGTRVEVHRHFSEVELGFFGIKTSLGSNFGFYMSLPFNPRRYRDAGPVRIRPAPRFPVQYRYQGNDFRARNYETGITLDDNLRQIYPSFLKKEMERFFRSE